MIFRAICQHPPFFIKPCNKLILSSMSAKVSTKHSCHILKRVLDKVHKPVCRHAGLNDMPLLFEMNILWSNTDDVYVCKTLKTCTSCHATAWSHLIREVSSSSLSTAFNEVCCIDLLCLDAIRLLHCMENAARYSAIFVLDSTALRESFIGCEVYWLSWFWIPISIQADFAFNHQRFQKYLKEMKVKFQLVPPQRHRKNQLKSKHSVIRNIYKRLKDSGFKEDAILLAMRAVDILNDP